MLFKKKKREKEIDLNIKKNPSIFFLHSFFFLRENGDGKQTKTKSVSKAH